MSITDRPPTCNTSTVALKQPALWHITSQHDWMSLGDQTNVLLSAAPSPPIPLLCVNHAYERGEGLDMGNMLRSFIKWWKQERKHVPSDRTRLWGHLMNSRPWAWAADGDTEGGRRRHREDFGEFVTHSALCWKLSSISLLLAVLTNVANQQQQAWRTLH